MQNVRSKITRLKNLINEKLPNNNIYDFSGNSRQNLIDSLDDAYNYSYKLNEMESDF